MNSSLRRLLVAAALGAWINPTPCLAQSQAKSTEESRVVTEVVVSGQQNASDWFRAESTHFVVYSDTNRANVSQLLEQLERLDYLLQLYASSSNSNKNRPATKLTLYYLKDLSDLRQLTLGLPGYAVGLYNSCAEGVQGFNAHLMFRDSNAAQLEKRRELVGLTYIFEAYARHFIYHNSDLRAPAWYIDGFAQYFASTRFSDTETVVGMAPQAIADYLGSVHSTGRYDSLDYQDILGGNDSKGPSLGGKDGVKLEFQAKSWILTHYILSSSDNIQRFRRYLDLQMRGNEQNAAFEQAFGFSVKQLSKVLWRYKWQGAEALKTNFSGTNIGEISFSDLPSSANQLLLADAALKSCPHQDRSTAILQQVEKEAKKFPNSDFAQLTLSRAQIQAGKPGDAIAFLTNKTRADKTSYDAFYLLGQAQTRLAETSEGAARQDYYAAAKASLLRACSLNPKAPEAFHAYFRAGVGAQEQPSEEVLGSAILATSLAREVSSYARSAALTYAYLGQTQNARDLLDMLASNQREPATAGWAIAWRGKLATGIGKEQIVAEMRALPPEPNRLSEWTYANAEVMQTITTAANRANANNLILDQQQQAQQREQQGAPMNGNPNN
jgi:hypothetical protein